MNTILPTEIKMSYTTYKIKNSSVLEQQTENDKHVSSFFGDSFEKNEIWSCMDMEGGGGGYKWEEGCGSRCLPTQWK